MNKFFIEIGSADYDTLLPLTKNGWCGIVVEPNKNLLDNIRGVDNVIYENVALFSYDGKISFNYYNESLYDDNESNYWTKGVGTINLEINHMHPNPQFKKYERSEEVECLTLDTLLKKHNVTNIDFMKVDVEGSEYKIFESYSWLVKPSVLKLETRHWESFGDYYNFKYIDTMLEMLRENGYLMWEEKNDLYAVR
tara:strand:- start:1478 stop:2062 length:585 start_codon:yes stop_codon:yes gene_type:complete